MSDVNATNTNGKNGISILYFTLPLIIILVLVIIYLTIEAERKGNGNNLGEIIQLFLAYALLFLSIFISVFGLLWGTILFFIIAMNYHDVKYYWKQFRKE